MKKYILTHIDDSEYACIVTILDYEIRLSYYLSELWFPFNAELRKKVLVDLALKSGVDEFRFVDFPICQNGKIDISRHAYVNVETRVESMANEVLCENSEIVNNSILSEEKKRKILSVC
ncbi:hypothetical protein M2150_002033 [Lachnospiraceae bacterium PM6-15]|uniref:Type II toxin-antitoxin system RnlB family antitoxin n=1 Tax=Ohessyouella blattaphilus TaxID=2949333 RepID=A0ABT1ELJ4_9FIRM|nr:type II toxin-antitoxin system RnlB family antitoxin [Ohessyouella blattaphilus]MCP1111560.1 type II toxin-antitoxin system RnlB family antitoxin [Ohessyouella blattaphilus]MCR8564954.1 type II toxin-antitoxin system RnlB family antitoxin [Ohessyouella blattaphilus]